MPTFTIKGNPNASFKLPVEKVKVNVGGVIVTPDKPSEEAEKPVAEAEKPKRKVKKEQ